jgi:uncharacterized protein (TIGR02391 family)
MELNELISPRIEKHCISLYNDKYYKHAAREAMTQVELALKEKGMVKDNRYGVNLVRSVLSSDGKQKNIKLRVPLGDDLQEQAKNLFEGAFSYYRNYVVHDGSKIDERICMRIFILASELLEMIDASSLSYTDLGGMEGLLKSGVFYDKNQLHDMLVMLEQYHLLDGDADGLMEDLFEKFGAGDEQINAVIELDLVRYQEIDYIPDKEEKEAAWQNSSLPDTIGWFELTDLGEKVVEEIEKVK